MKTILITAVGAPPGLNVLRALHESEKYNLILSDANKNAIGLYQYNLPYFVSPLASDKNYLETIIAFAKKHNVDGIIPCIEEDALLFSKKNTKLKSEGINTNLPNYNEIKIASNKGFMTKKCKENGIPHPKSIVVKFGEEGLNDKVSDFYRTIKASCIVKPTFGHGMQGVYTVNSVNEILDKVELLKCECILQEKIPGKAGSMYLSALLYDGNGSVIRSFASRSLLTLYEDGGPATAGESVYAPELINRLKVLVESIGRWCGPINAEWMLDPRDNEWKFIEVNPRHWGYGYLAVASGCNFPLANAAVTCGDDPGKDSGYEYGIVIARNNFDYVMRNHPFKLLDSPTSL